MTEHGVRTVAITGDEPQLVQCLCGKISALNAGRSVTGDLRAPRGTSKRMNYGGQVYDPTWALTGRYKDGTITLSPIVWPDHFETDANTHVRTGDVDLDLRYRGMRRDHDALHDAKTPHDHSGHGLPTDHER